MGQYNQIPSFYNLKRSLKMGPEQIALYLDINNKDKIVHFGYQLSFDDEQWHNFLEQLGDLVVDQSVENARKLDEDQFTIEFDESIHFSLIFFFFVETLQELENGQGGLGPGVEVQKRQSSVDLVCRCFGVYRQEIEEFFIRMPNSSLKQLSAKTLAGCGCGVCWDDIEKIMVQTREENPVSAPTLSPEDQEAFNRHIQLFLSFSQKLQDAAPSIELVGLGKEVGLVEISSNSTVDLNLEAVGASLKDFLSQKMPRQWTIKVL